MYSMSTYKTCSEQKKVHSPIPSTNMFFILNLNLRIIGLRHEYIVITLVRCGHETTSMAIYAGFNNISSKLAFIFQHMKDSNFVVNFKCNEKMAKTNK